MNVYKSLKIISCLLICTRLYTILSDSAVASLTERNASFSWLSFYATTSTSFQGDEPNVPLPLISIEDRNSHCRISHGCTTTGSTLPFLIVFSRDVEGREVHVCTHIRFRFSRFSGRRENKAIRADCDARSLSKRSNASHRVASHRNAHESVRVFNRPESRSSSERETF